MKGLQRHAGAVAAMAAEAKLEGRRNRELVQMSLTRLHASQSSLTSLTSVLQVRASFAGHV